MSGYIGSVTPVSTSGVERKKVFAITTTTTELTGVVYTPNFVQVFHNGIRLVSTTDYTATNGTSITLLTAAENGDQVVVQSFATFSPADTVSASAGGTFAGDVTVSGAFTSLGIDDNAVSTAITIDGSQNVGIGTSLPSANLHVLSSGDTIARVTSADGSGAFLDLGDASDPDGGRIVYDSGSNLTFSTASVERLRIDASGNVLLGKTTADNTTEGFTFYGTHDGVSIVKAEGAPLILNRLTNDGGIAVFRKNGSTVGSIGSRSGSSNLFINSTSNSGRLACNSTEKYGWNLTTFWATTDNANDLGSTSSRWDDVYATNGTIQTSDRNEKQDIEVLTAAETAVAVACKGLLRKFRWIDSVTEKGDDARIHFGIIAQDLQDAFTAEGLDAGRYAMFISSTWWETQTDVPAVVAVDEVLDEDGGVVTEAVDAVDAYTRTDTFDEVTEGATERTRLGVRYPELLAFIIGAL